MTPRFYQFHHYIALNSLVTYYQIILANEYANLKLVDVVPCRESFCDIQNKIKKDKTVLNC